MAARAGLVSRSAVRTKVHTSGYKITWSLVDSRHQKKPSDVSKGFKWLLGLGSNQRPSD